MHILVVEDEQRLAYLLRRVLLEERHTVDLAHDGHAGLDLALSDTYDAMILDLMLPGIDGLEVCRQLRAERIMTPVLMLTARGAVEDRVTGLKVGADDYLTKPFSMRELVARVSMPCCAAAIVVLMKPLSLMWETWPSTWCGTKHAAAVVSSNSPLRNLRCWSI